MVIIPESSICLIDSDPAVRDSLRSLAELYGQAMRCYATTRAFMDDLENVSLRCIVCEARLPDVRGVEVHVALIKRGFRVPFALLVSRDIEQAQTEAIDYGIDLVVPKPILDPRALIEFFSTHSGTVQGAPNEA